MVVTYGRVGVLSAANETTATVRKFTLLRASRRVDCSSYGPAFHAPRPPTSLQPSRRFSFHFSTHPHLLPDERSPVSSFQQPLDRGRRKRASSLFRHRTYLRVRECKLGGIPVYAYNYVGYLRYSICQLINGQQFDFLSTRDPKKKITYAE